VTHAPVFSVLAVSHGAPQMETVRAIMKGLGFNGKPTSKKAPIILTE
jgi:hypothetical protein